MVNEITLVLNDKNEIIKLQKYDKSIKVRFIDFEFIFDENMPPLRVERFEDYSDLYKMTENNGIKDVLFKFSENFVQVKVLEKMDNFYRIANTYSIKSCEMII